MYRTQPLRQEMPTRNCRWLVSVGLLLIFQTLYLIFRALPRESLLLLGYIQWDVWVVMAVAPFLALLIGESVKKLDKKIFDRFVLFLRLEFNTRLGTHSPR